MNAIAPGYVETEMNARLMADEVRFRQISERIPAGRWGRVEDFMGVVVFLASGASQYVCGEVIVVDGVSGCFFFLVFLAFLCHTPPHCGSINTCLFLFPFIPHLSYLPET